jgi:hypothetical protein
MYLLHFEERFATKGQSGLLERGGKEVCKQTLNAIRVFDPAVNASISDNQEHKQSF